jgi:hypothetical protein
MMIRISSLMVLTGSFSLPLLQTALLGAPSTLASETDERVPREAFVQEVAGRYAHYDIVAYEAPLPMRTMRSLVITYGFTDFHVEGETLIESETFCHASYKANLPISTQVSDAFTRAIIPRSTPVELRPHGESWMIWRPETPTPLGVDLADGEPLATDPAHANPRDDDHDGKQGVTVHMQLFGLIPAEMYIARRERFAYELTPQESGKLTGVVHDQSEQLVLGASHRWLKRQTFTRQDPDLRRSPILLVPVGEDYDCDRLMAERNSLFPPEPRVPRSSKGL